MNANLDPLTCACEMASVGHTSYAKNPGQVSATQLLESPKCSSE